MDDQYYQAWKKSHCVQPDLFDVSDRVMEQISQKTAKPHFFKRAWEISLLNWFEPRVQIQGVMFFLGALLGVVRLFLQMTSLLFA